MGMFTVQVRVANPGDPARWFDEDFWVDTGALYSFVPEDRLAAIGLAPLGSREIILADGRRERRLFGEARMTVQELGETLTCPLMFDPSGSLYLLGATALERFGVKADPVGKRLKPIPAVIGSFLAGGWAHRVPARPDGATAARPLRRQLPDRRRRPCAQICAQRVPGLGIAV